MIFFSKISFSNIIVLAFCKHEPNVTAKFLLKMNFRNFGFNALLWVFGHFETVRPIFNFVALLCFFGKYFNGDVSFSITMFRQTAFLVSGPYGSPLTTNGRVEDLDR